MSVKNIKPLTTTRWSSTDPADRFAVENPATGDVITVVQGGGAHEMEQAIIAANTAYENDWRHRSPEERSRLLFRCADVLEQHADEIAHLETLENGKPFNQARVFDVNTLISIFRYFASIVDKIPGEMVDQGGMYTSTVLEPVGVVGAIIPFNWPPIHTASKLAPALAVGNSVVLKPGEQTPLTPMYIVELLQTVLPPDVLHVVPGTGKVAGEALSSHPLVKRLTFTGSTGAGISILNSAAKNITPALLELGGKNAFIVFEDADIDRAVRDALEGGYFNQGESCTASSRLLVQRSVYETFIEKFAAGVKKLQVGNGENPATHVGPLVSKPHQQKVQHYIDLAVKEGAHIAAQAALPVDPALKNGFFVQPTLFRDVSPDMTLFKDEVFGPVVSVTPFDTLEDAVSLTNQSEYGLVCGVYTTNIEKALQVSRLVDVGMVMMNNYSRRGPLPFGGAKHSGYGREQCIDTLKEYGRLKVLRFPSGKAPIPSWNAVNDIFK